HNITTPFPSPLHPLSLHDALPISPDFNPSPRVRQSRPKESRRELFPLGSEVQVPLRGDLCREGPLQPLFKPDPKVSVRRASAVRSEEHTSELQSPYDLVCRLLLEK